MYWGPNDETAQEALDLAHHGYMLLKEQKLYLAPINKPQKVLDVGTGTGIWAIDFADQHPEAMSTTQPSTPGPSPPTLSITSTSARPLRLHPRLDRLHETVPHLPQARRLSGSKQCLRLARERRRLHPRRREIYPPPVGPAVRRVRRAHGQDDDEKYTLRQWGRLFGECGERTGKTTTISENQRGVMVGAGFEAVEETRFKLVVGLWPKDPALKQVGHYHQLECLQACEGWALALLTRVIKWDVEEVQVLLANFRASVKDKSIHSYTPVSVVVGRKSLGDAEGE
ncbi:hypothetical protein ACJ73_06793 [Blastomyces percursus]|uniref:Methyltransferase domain-containing protein n=1 Tax=Blastomyces percursus TaxID=1658174 RepID=A0A1J9R056_9EURO|nr:hypothetical protein ACJ73_06793 [Blastomyces percursus]